MLQALSRNRLSGLAQKIAPIKQAMQNPQALLQMMGPQYAQIQSLIAANGGDAQKAFYNLANQMGVDPQEVLNALK